MDRSTSSASAPASCCALTRGQRRLAWWRQDLRRPPRSGSPSDSVPSTLPLICSSPRLRAGSSTSISTTELGGEGGIRTHGGFHHTAFRELHLQPLGHLSRTG